MSSNNLEEAKQKFIRRLEEVESGKVQKMMAISSTFDKFAYYFFEKFYKRKVSESTFRVAMYEQLC